MDPNHMSMLFIECIAHVCIYFGIRTVLSGLYQFTASRQWSTLVTMDNALSHVPHPVSKRSMLYPNVAPSRGHRHLFGVVLLFVYRRTSYWYSSSDFSSRLFVYFFVYDSTSPARNT